MFVTRVHTSKATIAWLDANVKYDIPLAYTRRVVVCDQFLI